MSRAVCSLPVGIRYFNPSEARWVGTMIPRKQANDDTSEFHFGKEETEPVVAFSRPPPIPPYLGLGPLVVLSLFDAWSKRDKNDA
ncbi:hypothetical protein LIER_34023 [Lithospermum erythrorhizon]|uniref:Uncharacterized protein n=1 Tax=Lithospermum erythrorhizon TaxID=34254 RepID=A0AAV3S1G7_LITER